MNTIENPKAEAQALLAQLNITAEISNPRPGVEDNWPHIAYVVTFLRGSLPPLPQVWKCGIGHVKTTSPDKGAMRILAHLSTDEESMLRAWHLNPHANFKDKALQASVAAKLAFIQKVKPDASEVLACMCRDAIEATESTFEEWAANFGYETDSRKAEATYNACRAPYASLIRICGGIENMRKLSEIQF